MHCVLQVVKTPTILLNNPVFVRAINNGVKQANKVFLECLIHVRAFHEDVAGEIKHKLLAVEMCAEVLSHAPICA